MYFFCGVFNPFVVLPFSSAALHRIIVEHLIFSLTRLAPQIHGTALCFDVSQSAVIATGSTVAKI